MGIEEGGEEMTKREDSVTIALQSELEAVKEELQTCLYTNSLTGLKNRRALLKDIEKSSIPTLFLIDINDYSRYIDVYGNEISNELLLMFAELLEAFNDEKKYELYHIENSIFCMLHPSEFIDTQKYEDDLFEIIETIKANPLYIPTIDEVFFLNINIGIASEVTNLLNRAYDALNIAKKNKKQFVYYRLAHENSDEQRNILHVKREIQKNIEANNFIPVYQAIVNPKGEVIKYESLLRMRQDDKLVPPFHFLDIAAKTHQYETISHKTLLRAVEEFKERTELLSLNFAQADINNKELLREIEALLQKYDMAQRTVFEIVESDAIDDYNMTRAFVERFRTIGVRIAIDDFGSGYANFSHIMELEPEYLKIDGSLIKDIQEDKKSLIMVKAIVQFAHDLRIKTIAEYVANEEIFEILLALNVDEYQGFYFGKPEPLYL